MNPDDQNLINILLKQSYVSEDDVKKATFKAKESGTSLTNSLLSLGLITKPLLGQAIAESFGAPFANLETNPPSQDQVTRIPAELGKKYPGNRHLKPLPTRRQTKSLKYGRQRLHSQKRHPNPGHS